MGRIYNNGERSNCRDAAKMRNLTRPSPANIQLNPPVRIPVKFIRGGLINKGEKK